MNRQKTMTKLVNVGKYVAMVDVELTVTEDDWSPYLSVEDAFKLDDVRMALQHGDLVKAGQFAQIFELMPIAA